MKKILIIIIAVALAILFTLIYLIRTDFFFKRKLDIEEGKCGYGDKKTMDCLRITSDKVWVDEVKTTERILENYEGWTTMKLDWSGLVIVEDKIYSTYMDDYFGLNETEEVQD